HLGYAQAHIGEWMAPNFQRFHLLEVWLLGVLALLATGWRVPPLRLIIVLALVHLALGAQRHAELLGLLSPLVLATPLGLHLATLVSNSMLPVRTRPARWATLGMAVLVAGGAVIFLTQRQPFAPPAAITPQAAVQAVQAAGIRGEVFNDYDYGGYL